MLVVGTMAMVLALLTALLVLGSALVGGGRARTAADLAALAGAGRLLEGRPEPAACAEAARVAAANGARLVECRGAVGEAGGPGLTVLVSVRPPIPMVPTPSARARAGAVPGPG